MIGPVTGGVVYDYMGFEMATFFVVVMFVVIVSWLENNLKRENVIKFL